MKNIIELTKCPKCKKGTLLPLSFPNNQVVFGIWICSINECGYRTRDCWDWGKTSDKVVKR